MDKKIYELLLQLVSLQIHNHLKLEKMAFDIDQLTKDVAEENTQIASYETLMEGLVGGLKDEISDLKAQGVDTSKLEAISNAISQGKSSLAEAIKKNTSEAAATGDASAGAATTTDTSGNDINDISTGGSASVAG